MKKIVVNPDETINLNGLTKEDVFLLYVLLANTSSTLSYNLYRALGKIFPSYFEINKELKLTNPPSPLMFCSAGDCALIKDLANKHFKRNNKTETNSSSRLERDAMGRFISKKNKIIVRFWYPCSETNNPIYRAVVIDKNENLDLYLYFSGVLENNKAITIPSRLVRHKNILGFDRARNDVRNFNILKIKANNTHILVSKE
jgi:hypothetical protein